MDENTNNLTSPQEETITPKGTDSQASRIMSVKDASPLLVITIFFIFSNILFGYLINIPLLILLFIFIGITYRHWRNPGQFPKRLTKYCDRIIRRSEIFPVELVLLVGILLISIVQFAEPNMSNKWYQFSYCSLIVLAFFLTELGNKAAYTGHRGWKILWDIWLKPLFFSNKRKREEPLTSIKEKPPEADLRHELITPEQIEMDSDGQLQPEKGLWEGEQKKRWKEWIKEEMNRLDGSSLDESK